jgi:Tfp pilus assembly protein PilO
MGRYKAEVIMTYGTENQLVVASTYFWLLPIKLIIAVIVAILVVILGFMSIRRHMIHKRQDQSNKINELETKLKQLESENSKV